MLPPEQRGRRWTVVVPLKPAARGKSRLTGASVELVRALGLDTVAAAASAASVARVLVVTSDAATADALAAHPAVSIVDDPERGLGAAVAAGAAAAGGAVPIAAMLGDLPALRPAELDTALALAAAYERAVVPDADGTGSTLVTASAGTPWRSAFGPDSFARHRALGCVTLELDPASGLRRDVDTLAQLDAVLPEAGPRTRTAAAAPPPPSSAAGPVRSAGRRPPRP